MDKNIFFINLLCKVMNKKIFNSLSDHDMNKKYILFVIP